MITYTAGPAIQADGLVRSFAQTRAVDGVSIAVRPGELYGLVGPDGAGKSTTMRMLVGLVKPDRGAVRFGGADTSTAGSGAREAVGYMPQQYSLYGDLSVAENLRFFGRLFGLTSAERAEREARLLAVTRLECFRDRRADALSGGMYKKLALACALLHRPRVLVLDEPTNGVDPVSRRELWDLLYEFVGEGMAVLLATPYMDEAARCHRVGLLHHGRLIAEGEPASLVRACVHAAFAVTAADRDGAEALIEARPEVIAHSPQGSGLRVIVDSAARASFEAWAATAPVPMVLEAMAPDFEDVFLGLVAAPHDAPEEADA